MDKLRSESNWDTDALNAWDEALKRRDEDNNLLKQFSMEDQKKANELEARRKNLQTEVLKRKELVTKMAAELTNYEMVLDRTSRQIYVVFSYFLFSFLLRLQVRRFRR